MDYEDLLAKYNVVDALENMTVRVGWVDGNGSARKAYENMQTRKKTGKPTKSLGIQPSNALIARTLNYGREPGSTANGRAYGRIIARPFMTYAKERFEKQKEKILAKYVPMVISGKMAVYQLAEAIGAFYKDAVTEAIRDSSKYPAVSERTLRARRRHGSSSSVPLIDTHQLIDSVSFEVK